MFNDDIDKNSENYTNPTVLFEIMKYITNSRLKRMISNIKNLYIYEFYYIKSLETNLTFATGDTSGNLHLWDVSNNKVFKILKGHTNSVKCILKFNDEILISGSYDNKILIWNLETFEILFKLEGHKEFVRALTKIDDLRFASGANDHTIKIWTIKGEILKTFYGSSCFVLCFLNLENNIFMTGTGDGNIFVWDFEGEDKPINCLKGHTLPVWCLAKSNQHGQNVFFSGSGDGIVKKWNFQIKGDDNKDNNANNLEFKFEGNILKKSSNVINIMNIRKNIIAIFLTNCEIIFYDFVKNKVCGKLNSISNEFIQLCVSELIINRFILTGYSNGNIDVWDIKRKDNFKILTLNYYEKEENVQSKEINKSIKSLAFLSAK